MNKYGFRNKSFFFDMDYVYATSMYKAKQKIKEYRDIKTLKNYEIWKY
jgi:hypothetical protein